MPKPDLRNQQLLSDVELKSRLGELYRAIDQYNRRWYVESHETLEDLWMVTPPPGREFMQGIIQLAAAFVHYARREYPGILKLLDLAIEKLERFEPEAFAVDVTALVRDIRQVRERFTALGEERFLEFDERDSPRIVLRAGE